MEQYRFGDWVKCEEDNWVSVDYIGEIDIRYQGSETRHEDYYEVELTLKTFDLWLPNVQDREIARKHNNFFNQMSEPHKRTVYLGPKEKCEKVAKQIMNLPESKVGIFTRIKSKLFRRSSK